MKKKNSGTKRNAWSRSDQKYLGLSFDDSNVKNEYWHPTDFMQCFNMFLFMESLLAFLTPTYCTLLIVHKMCVHSGHQKHAVMLGGHHKGPGCTESVNFMASSVHSLIIAWHRVIHILYGNVKMMDNGPIKFWHKDRNQTPWPFRQTKKYLSHCQ